MRKIAVIAPKNCYLLLFKNIKWLTYKKCHKSFYTEFSRSLFSSSNTDTQHKQQ